MTENETKKIIMTIEAAFPNWKPQAPKEFVVNLWHKFLASFDQKEVARAVQVYIATDTSGFAPTIGQVIDHIHVLVEPEQLNDMQAWALVAKAIQNSSYNSKAEFARLPLIVQKAVGSEQQLKIWATDENYNANVVSSNFIKTYRNVVQREKELAKMPIEIRSLIKSNIEAVQPTLGINGINTHAEHKNVSKGHTTDNNIHTGMPLDVKKQFEDLKKSLYKKE